MQSNGAFRRVPRGHTSSHRGRLTSPAASLRLQGLLPGDDLGRDILQLEAIGGATLTLGQFQGIQAAPQVSAFRIVRLSETDLVIADPGENILMRRLVSRGGELCGAVEDLLLALELRKVLFLYARLKGHGSNELASVVVPVEAIKRIGPENVYVEHSFERVCGAPRFDFTSSPRDWSASVYEYFGYPAFRPRAVTQDDRAYIGEHPYWSALPCYSPHLCLPDSEIL